MARSVAGDSFECGIRINEAVYSHEFDLRTDKAIASMAWMYSSGKPCARAPVTIFCKYAALGRPVRRDRFWPCDVDDSLQFDAPVIDHDHFLPLVPKFVVVEFFQGFRSAAIDHTEHAVAGLHDVGVNLPIVAETC